MKLYKAALPILGLATLASACGGANTGRTQNPPYAEAMELSREYGISYELAERIVEGHKYANGFSESPIDLNGLEIAYIGDDAIAIVSDNAEDVASTLREYLPKLESLLGKFPCKGYSIFTGGFNVAQSDDCASMIDNNALYEDSIIHELVYPYMSNIEFPLELSWLKYGFAEYVAREMRNSWDLFDRIYKGLYDTDIPASKINADTHDGEWAYYALMGGTRILRQIDFGDTGEERIGNLWNVIKSLGPNPTLENAVKALSAYASSDFLEESIIGKYNWKISETKN